MTLAGDWARILRRFFSGEAGTRAPEVHNALARHTTAARAAAVQIRIFYAFLMFVVVNDVPLWWFYFSKPNLVPIWPTAWVPLVGVPTGVAIIEAVVLISTLIAIVVPQFRVVRIAVFIGILEYVALRSSYGKIGHSGHLGVLIAFCLIFLPAGWQDVASGRRVHRQSLLVFWTAQALVLLTYTMAGIGKIGGAIWQMTRGETHAFMPDALAIHIADRLLQTNSESVIGDFLIRHPILAWPGMLGAIFLQAFALYAAFRPRLMPIWATGLIVFHVLSYFTMTILFPQNCFLLALFFLNPVWLQQRWDWRLALGDLPLVGVLLRRTPWLRTQPVVSCAS